MVLPLADSALPSDVGRFAESLSALGMRLLGASVFCKPRLRIVSFVLDIVQLSAWFSFSWCYSRFQVVLRIRMPAATGCSVTALRR